MLRAQFVLLNSNEGWPDKALTFQREVFPLRHAVMHQVNRMLRFTSPPPPTQDQVVETFKMTKSVFALGMKYRAGFMWESAMKNPCDCLLPVCLASQYNYNIKAAPVFSSVNKYSQQHKSKKNRLAWKEKKRERKSSLCSRNHLKNGKWKITEKHTWCRAWFLVNIHSLLNIDQFIENPINCTNEVKRV